MDGVAHEAAANVLAQASEKDHDIVHLHYLASHQEHDTQRRIPGKGEKQIV